MGSSEPSFVPEWLRSNGHGNSGASAANHFASANSHSDDSVVGNSARNRLYRTNTEIDNPRALLERSSSINSRRSSSNSSSLKHPYGSFSRSHRDKERDKEKSGFGDFSKRDGSEPLGKDSLRRTQSMTSRNQGDPLPRGVASDPKNIEINNHFLRNGLVTGDKFLGSMPKVSLEKDFPSLGADEKQVPNVVRVASPGLPIGSSSLVGEGWSALAEVPVVIGRNNSAQSLHQPLSTSVALSINSGGSNAVSAASKTASGTSYASSGPQRTSSDLGSFSALNMAEALVQSPSVSRTTPQLSIETQRLEQMAIKKVRQLIPMTPATPKVLSSSDKHKPKLNARAGEISGASKVGKHLSSSSLNAVGQSPRSGPVTSDASKQSHGSKLVVLKPPWENSVSSTSKDGSTLENLGAAIRPANNLHATPTASSAPVKCTKILKASISERKPVVSSLNLASAVEKRPLSSSAKSRSDFFNAVRKKTLMTTAVASETDSCIQSPSEKKPCELLQEMISTSHLETENDSPNSKDDSNSEVLKSSNREKSSIPWAEDIPDEEEAAFLRSLGWEESGEEGGLTEEEINDFFQVVMKLRPSLNLSPGVQPAFSLLTESHASTVGESYARLRSPDAAPKSN